MLLYPGSAQWDKIILHLYVEIVRWIFGFLEECVGVLEILPDEVWDDEDHLYDAVHVTGVA